MAKPKTKPTCRWVLSPAALGTEGKYCGAEVSYFIARDEDQNTYRKYNTFCDEHMKEAANLRDSYED